MLLNRSPTAREDALAAHGFGHSSLSDAAQVQELSQVRACCICQSRRPVACAFTPRCGPCPQPNAAGSSRRRRGRPGRSRFRSASSRLPRHRARRPCGALTDPAAAAAGSARVSMTGQSFHVIITQHYPSPRCLRMARLRETRVQSSASGRCNLTSLACKLSSSPAKELKTGPTAPPPLLLPARQ